MDKKTQDRLWASLDKQARWSMRTYYYANFGSSQVDDVAKNTASVLEYVFGEHNLTSDAEPSELAFIERSVLIDRYSSYSKESDTVKNNEPYLQFCEGRLNALANLFGDKCLPDEEKQNSPKLSNSFQIGKDEQPSVQVEPRFKVGDIVLNAFCNSEHLTIIEVIVTPNKVNFQYRVKEYPYLWNEYELEPYTEPSNVSADETMNETKATMEEKELAGQWRSVEDELPNPEQDVFVATQEGHGYTYGYAWLTALSNGTCKWCSHDDYLHLDEVRFWMPIPELPKPDKQ